MRNAHSALFSDLYEFTMAQGYYRADKGQRAVFEMFFRRSPFAGGYVVFAGLEPLLLELAELRFSSGDLNYLSSLGLFHADFLDYLRDFRFRGDVDAMAEGTPAFAGEPLIRVEGTLTETQLIEGLVLNVLNFQTLIATKAARVTQAAAGRPVIEFGLRRAQGIDGALSASRAAFIGGTSATSNVQAGRIWGIPVRGTMAHSWVMLSEDEEEAFRLYAALYPESTTLLVDTYDSLTSGIPHAVNVLSELKLRGGKNFGIRLDSGDLDYLSRRAREMLDAAGLADARITVSNDLDESIIQQLVESGAPIDYFGVGTSLVTASGDSALSGVYKMAAIRDGLIWNPRIKISDNAEKTTNPGRKSVIRIWKDDFMTGDIVCLEEEKEEILEILRTGLPLTVRHPFAASMRRTIEGAQRSEELLRPVLREGSLVSELPSLAEIRQNAAKNLAELHPTSRRILNPHVYKVGLSERLWNLKSRMVETSRKLQGGGL